MVTRILFAGGTELIGGMVDARLVVREDLVLEKHARARVRPGWTADDFDALTGDPATGWTGFGAASDDLALSAARLAGGRAAVCKAGPAYDPRLVPPGDLSAASGRAAAEMLLTSPERPGAVVASSDRMALAEVQVTQERGWR